MSESELTVLCEHCGCEKIPEWWAKNYPSLHESYLKEQDTFCPEEKVDKFENEFHCFDGYLDCYRKASREVLNDPYLKEFTYFLARTLSDFSIQKEIIKGLPKTLSKKEFAYQMVYGVASLYILEVTVKNLREKGISDDLISGVLRLNMILVKSYERRHDGAQGYDLLDWARNYFRGKIFRIGRFEVEFFAKVKVKDSPLEEAQLINLHIPPNEPFTKDVIDASFREILAFRKKIFPNEPYAGFHCTSWLLSPMLKDVLPKESNILAFQNRFHMLQLTENDKSVYDFVFSMPDMNFKIEDLPERTSLQRNIKAYCMSGKKIFDAEGWIPKEELERFEE